MNTSHLRHIKKVLIILSVIITILFSSTLYAYAEISNYENNNLEREAQIRRAAQKEETYRKARRSLQERTMETNEPSSRTGLGRATLGIMEGKADRERRRLESEREFERKTERIHKPRT